MVLTPLLWGLFSLLGAVLTADGRLLVETLERVAGRLILADCLVGVDDGRLTLDDERVVLEGDE